MTPRQNESGCSHMLKNSMASELDLPASQMEPVSGSERITSLDTLRGVALLGILLVNMFSFAAPSYENPSAYGDFHGLNYWAWLFSHVAADRKFITIFSMLLGAGIFLFTSRIENAGKPSAVLHYRRMGWLIVFGLMHGYLLWFGDILVHYGICGLFVYPLRKWPVARLLVLGTFLLGVPVVTGLVYERLIAPADLADIKSDVRPNSGQIAENLAAYRGGWLSQMHARSAAAFEFETTVFGWEFFWRELGLMLIGIVLFRMGLFSARLQASTYWSMLAAGAVIGIPIIVYGVHRSAASGWDVRYVMFRGVLYNYWASLLVAMGWVGAVMLAFRSTVMRGLTRIWAAVGRMAFSNYILQTVIGTTIFYGHGLGLYGRVSRVGQLALVLCIWMVQMTISPLWLKHFRFGPLEWLWRSLTYWERQPFHNIRVRTTE
jgi:uncharacterized protein